MTRESAVIIQHLLDRLCEYEEAVVESATYPDGSLDRNDAASAVAVLQARRVWQRAQSLMIELERIHREKPKRHGHRAGAEA